MSADYRDCASRWVVSGKTRRKKGAPKEWGAIDEAPCTIRHLPIPPHVAAFYDFETFERLVSAARDRVTLLILLLGGEAGLRAGEFRALEWRDVDFKAGRLSVPRWTFTTGC